MGVSSSGSGFKTKLAAAGYYGLIETDGSRRTLTARGADIVSDDQERVEAARAAAVMSTTFGPILFSLRGRVANEAIVASRLQGDHGVPPASAEHLARVLMTSAQEAGLMTDGRFDAIAIEAHESAMPSETPSPTNSTTRTPTTSTAPRKERVTQNTSTAGQTKLAEKNGKEATPPFVPPVQIVINVDASKLSAQEIAELVKALQQPPTS